MTTVEITVYRAVLRKEREGYTADVYRGEEKVACKGPFESKSVARREALTAIQAAKMSAGVACA